MKTLVGILLTIALVVTGSSMFLTSLLESNIQSGSTCGSNANSERSASSALEPGDRVPSFELKLLGDGETVTDESLRGSYYLIYFWSTSCGICHREMPVLNDVYQEFKDDNFNILSITGGSDHGEIREFLEEYNLTQWKTALIDMDEDSLRKIQNAFDLRGVPHKVLVSPEGEVLHVSRGYSGDEMLKDYAAYLK